MRRPPRSTRTDTLFPDTTALPICTAGLPVTFMRVHHMPPATAGFAFGLAIMTMGPLGAWLGGVIAERLDRRGVRESQLSATACACVIQLAAKIGRAHV